jgi:tetratricopeptide (TPR) repeat protein
METKAQTASPWTVVGLLLIVGFTVGLTHWPALSARALCFDDNQYLVDNPLVKNPGWSSAWRFLAEIWKPTTVSGYYQPLTMISLMIDYAFARSADNLTPFHVTSLILHIANTLLVIVLLYLLFGNIWVAAAVGLLFGVHPMTVETIAWVGERKTLLSAFFAFWCLIAYVLYQRKSSRRYYILSLLAYILAMMAKPISLTLPLLMLLMDFWPFKRLGKKAILEKIPFFVLMGFFAAVTYISQKLSCGVVPPSPGHSLLRIFYILCHNIMFYPLKMIWPVNLSSHYSFPDPLDFSDTMIRIGVVGTIVLLPLLILSLRFTRACVTGWLIFFVAILPTMQIFRFSNVIASDKFAYLPSVGLLILLTWSLVKLANIIRGKSAVFGIVLAVSILTVASGGEIFAARRYLTRWSNTETLYRHMLTFAPNAPSLHFNLGYALHLENRVDEALEEYYRTIELDPNDGPAHQNLAMILDEQGLLDEAVKEYRIALKYLPNPVNAHNNLANTLNKQGHTQQAVYHLEQALTINPHHGPSHFNLAMILFSQGDYQNAIIHLSECIKYSPDFSPAYFNLGVLLNQQNRAKEAIPYFRNAASLESENPAYLKALAATLLNQRPLQPGDMQQALTYAQKAAELTGYRDPAILSILAGAYANQGKLDKAVEICRQALTLANEQNHPVSDQLRQQLERFQTGRNADANSR